MDPSIEKLPSTFAIVPVPAVPVGAVEVFDVVMPLMDGVVVRDLRHASDVSLCAEIAQPLHAP